MGVYLLSHAKASQSRIDNLINRPYGVSLIAAANYRSDYWCDKYRSGLIINREGIRYDSMGRIMAIDYGRKRCGVAVTDTLQIAANGLPTQRTCDLEAFISDYCRREPVDRILVGHPRTVSGEESESMRYIRPFLQHLSKILPNVPVELVDERFTSVQAHRDMITAGFKRSDRQRKELADEMAAVLILTAWLDSRR